jgi:NAD(P)-dependent dehydrogenase (short-subunit alcohol dehydrogenase family)
MNRLFELKGEIAIVTGGLGHLGPVWSRALLEAGARVLALDLPSVSEPAAFSDLLVSFGKERLRLLRVDICQRNALIEVRDYCLREMGTPRILVNNAGVDQPPGPARTYRLEDIPPDLFQKVLNVNLFGAFQTTQVFGSEMVKVRRGSIINIGSLYAGVSPDRSFYDHLQTDPPFLKPPAYGASKAGLVNLTKYFAAHWGPYGVRVNALSPGGVLGEQDELFKKKFCARVPMGRMANHEDLMGPLIFLASNASSYVNGVELKVDGGFTAW